MLFSPTEISQIKFLLGYPPVDANLGNRVESQLELVTETNRKDYIVAVMDRIQAINTELATASSKSNIKKVGEIELDYSNLFGNLKRDGSRNIALLASLCDLTVQYDMFASSPPSLSVRSLSS